MSRLLVLRLLFAIRMGESSRRNQFLLLIAVLAQDLAEWPRLEVGLGGLTMVETRRS